MLLAAFLLSLVSVSPDPKVPQVMHQFLSHMIALEPFLKSEKAFGSSRNKKEIMAHIKDMKKLSESVSHTAIAKGGGYKISAVALQNHLKDLESVFANGNPRFARSMMLATLDGCASCHNQIPAKSLNWNIENALPASLPQFDKARFLYSTRQWDPAFKIFDSLIVDYPKVDLDSDDLDSIVDFKLAYLLRVKRDPKLAREEFEKYLKNSKLPKGFRSRIQYLNFVLSILAATNIPPIQTVSAQKLDKFAETLLAPVQAQAERDFNDTHKATFLYVSGLLYEFLNTRNSSEWSPEIFYWLSVCDRWLNNQFFFSLSSQYLKECIERYPKSRTAKRCLADFEEQVVLDYTGSSGENIPADIEAEIDALKKKIGTSSK